MPPDTQQISNIKTKHKPESSGIGSLPTQKRLDYVNSIGTHTATSARDTDAHEEKARQASRSTPPKTTQAPTKETQIGSILKWQNKQQRHSKQPGTNSRSHRTLEDVILFEPDSRGSVVSLLASGVVSATLTRSCVTTTRHITARETL